MPNTAVLDDVHEKQLEAWIAEYSSAVLKLCFVYLADTELAKDAMQDTFVKVWKYMEQFQSRHDLSAKAWILKIAVNTCRDYKRTAWFRHIDMRKSIDELPEPMTPTPEISRELFMDVMNLPAKYKQVILLHHFQNLNQSETAQALGISRTSVAKRLKKAYGMLQFEPKKEGQP